MQILLITPSGADRAPDAHWRILLRHSDNQISFVQVQDFDYLDYDNVGYFVTEAVFVSEESARQGWHTILGEMRQILNLDGLSSLLSRSLKPLYSPEND